MTLWLRKAIVHLQAVALVRWDDFNQGAQVLIDGQWFSLDVQDADRLVKALAQFEVVPKQ